MDPWERSGHDEGLFPGEIHLTTRSFGMYNYAHNWMLEAFDRGIDQHSHWQTFDGVAANNDRNDRGISWQTNVWLFWQEMKLEVPSPLHTQKGGNINDRQSLYCLVKNPTYVDTKIFFEDRVSARKFCKVEPICPDEKIYILCCMT